MAKYGYAELKKSAQTGERIGRWKGINVYSCSKYNYDASSSFFWVIYDDHNKLVKGGYVYGDIDDTGAIDESASREWYNVAPRPNERVTKVTPATSGYSDQVIADEFFSRIDKEINALLAGVAELNLDVGELVVEA